MANVKETVLTITVTVLGVSLVVLFLIFAYKRNRDWVELFGHFYCVNPTSTQISTPKPGQIISRHIKRFGPIPGLYRRSMLHFGLYVDENTVYHSDIKRTHKNTFKEWMKEEDVFYIVEFPKGYRRSLDESIQMFEQWLEEERAQVSFSGTVIQQSNVRCATIPVWTLKHEGSEGLA